MRDWYRVWCAEHGEDEAGATDVLAVSPEWAAVGWLEAHNSENEMTDDEGVTVYVREPDGDVSAWRVSAQMEVRYSTERVEVDCA